MSSLPRSFLMVIGLTAAVGSGIAAYQFGAFDPAPPPRVARQEEPREIVIGPSPEQQARDTAMLSKDLPPLPGGYGVLVPVFRSQQPFDTAPKPMPLEPEAPQPVLEAAPASPFDVANLPEPPRRPNLESYAPFGLEAPRPPIRPASLGVLVRAGTPDKPGEPVLTPPALEPQTAEPPPILSPRLDDAGSFARNAQAFVRIFKKEGELELWLRRGGRLTLHKTYPICRFSGRLGPKIKEGDSQAPEGFYSVSARQLNPNSAYHRAFNVGYPNAYDRQHRRTGGALMVHGDCKSVGCYAMTNAGIEEIYDLVAGAVRAGGEVPVHIFPFRLSESAISHETKGSWMNMWGAQHGNWGDFWRNLKEGYDLFEKTGEPPIAYACNKRYAFGNAGRSCSRIAGW